MNSSRAIARYASWALLEGVGQVILALIGLIILARILGPDEFGLAALALMVVRTLNILCEFLFMDTLVQRQKLFDKDIDTAFSTTLFISISLVALCFFAAQSVAALFSRAELSGLIRFASLLLLFGGFNGIMVGLLRREFKFRQIATGKLIGRLFGLSLAITMVFTGFGVWSLVAQEIGSFAFASFVFFIISNRRPKLRFSIPSLRKLGQFAVPYVTSLSIRLGNERIFPILVGYLFGPVVLGYFDLASRVSVTLGRLAAVAAHQVTMSIFSRQQDSLSKLRNSMYKATEFLCVIGIPLFGGLAIVAPDLVVVVFGDQWKPAVPLLQLLAVGTMIRFCGNVMHTSLASVGRPIWLGLKYAAEFVVGGSCLFILSGFGSIAVGLAVVIRYILTLPIFLYANSKLIGIEWLTLLSASSKPLLAMILIGVSLLYLNNVVFVEWSHLLRLVTTVLIGVLSYFVLMWFLAPRLVRQAVRLASEMLPRYQADN